MTDTLQRPTPAGRRENSGRASNGWALSMALADRRNRARILTMALGIALAALELLAVGSVAPAFAAVGQRYADAHPTLSQPGTFDVSEAVVEVGGVRVTGWLLAPHPGSTPTAPPGTEGFPGPGEVIVSPALADLLNGPDGAAFVARVAGTVVGEIDPSTLPGPRALAFYQGFDRLNMQASSASGWGERDAGVVTLPPALWMVLITGTVILMIPLLLFVALASQLGSARRLHRSSTLRLLGASRPTIRLLVIVEAILAAIVGLTAAFGGFFLLRRALISGLFGERTVAVEDATPSLVAVLIVVIGTPLLAAFAALSGFRNAIDRPLDLDEPVERNRRLRWVRRLVAVAVVIGIGTVVVPIDQRWLGDPATILRLCLVIIADLLLLAAVVRPITGRLAAARDGGSPAWQLARGRLLGDGGAHTRASAGVATVLAGSVALTSLLGGYTRQPPREPTEIRDVSGTISGITITDWHRLETSIQTVPGVLDLEQGGQFTTDDPNKTVAVASCGSTDLAGLACTDGDVFYLTDGAVPRDVAARVITDGTQRFSWEPPSEVRLVQLGPWGVQFSPGVYILTPLAAELQLPAGFAALSLYVHVRLPYSSTTALYEAISWLGANAYNIHLLGSDPPSGSAALLAWVRTALMVAGLLVLAICALGQWLVAAEQIRERRRSFALSRASGVPSSVLRRSVLVTSLFPVSVGVVLGCAGGLLLSVQLGMLLSGGLVLSLDLPWTGFALAAIAVVTLAVGIGSAWRLSRTTSMESLRTE